MRGAWKFYEYNGNRYTLTQLCIIFKVKYWRVYRYIRFDKLSIFEALRQSELHNLNKDYFRSKTIFEQCEKYIEIITETFEENIPESHEICSSFGCGEELSLQEKLFGSKCTSCQRKEIKIVNKNEEDTYK